MSLEYAIRPTPDAPSVGPTDAPLADRLRFIDLPEIRDYLRGVHHIDPPLTDQEIDGLHETSLSVCSQVRWHAQHLEIYDSGRSFVPSKPGPIMDWLTAAAGMPHSKVFTITCGEVIRMLREACRRAGIKTPPEPLTASMHDRANGLASAAVLEKRLGKAWATAKDLSGIVGRGISGQLTNWYGDLPVATKREARRPITKPGRGPRHEYHVRVVWPLIERLLTSQR